MKIHPVRTLLLSLALCALGAQSAQAQQKLPRIGYVFPAGVQRGAACEIVVGGQYLQGCKELFVSGSGMKVEIVKIQKPIPQKRLNELRDYLMEARKKAQQSGEKPSGLLKYDLPDMIASVLKEAGATDDEIKGFLLIRKQRQDPKRQQNLQIAETVTLKIEVAADAAVGPREIRMLASSGLSNPLAFCVGSLPEIRKDGPLGKTLETALKVKLPAVLNGQILPGEVDHYAFQARRSERLVVAVQARDLIPYLADAVPGWFQPVIALYDAKGREVGFAKDFRFSPDPVCCIEAPDNGTYLLEIHDALYRGREDFVYRVTVGEVPFVTGFFPLGGRVGMPTAVSVNGWNIPRPRVILNPAPTEGIRTASDLSNGRVIADAPFASDTLPELMEQEPNNDTKQAQQVKLPVIINGRIDTPGDVDVFAFNCAAGAKVVAEVQARRLNSPLDSWLKITDETGRQLAFNDDWEDLGSGLLTHKADSYLTFTAPAPGVYYLHLGDTQHKGGPEYGYRLRISAPRPDFALRIVPSSINGRPGLVVPVTIHVLRKDGFAGDISCAFKGAPEGFSIQGGVIPEGQNKIQATVAFPVVNDGNPVNLAVEGHATIGGREVTHPAVPADDMLQAFMYHHLVPANALLAVCTGTFRGRPPTNIVGPTPIELPAGGVTRIIFATPEKGRTRPYEMQLEVRDPLEGITAESVIPVDEGMAISIRTDAAKLKPGWSGNLLLEVFFERTLPDKDGKPQPKARWSWGYLPAIPFKVVGK